MGASVGADAEPRPARPDGQQRRDGCPPMPPAGGCDASTPRPPTDCGPSSDYTQTPRGLPAAAPRAPSLPAPRESAADRCADDHPRSGPGATSQPARVLPGGGPSDLTASTAAFAVPRATSRRAGAHRRWPTGRDRQARHGSLSAAPPRHPTQYSLSQCYLSYWLMGKPGDMNGMHRHGHYQCGLPDDTSERPR